MHNIDVIDKKILRLIQIDALLSVADIAEKLASQPLRVGEELDAWKKVA